MNSQTVTQLSFEDKHNQIKSSFKSYPSFNWYKLLCHVTSGLHNSVKTIISVTYLCLQLWNRTHLIGYFQITAVFRLLKLYGCFPPLFWMQKNFLELFFCVLHFSLLQHKAKKTFLH